MKIPSRVSCFTSLCFFVSTFPMLFRSLVCVFPHLCFYALRARIFSAFLCFLYQVESYENNILLHAFAFYHWSFSMKIFYREKFQPNQTFLFEKESLMLIWAAELFHKDVSEGFELNSNEPNRNKKFWYFWRKPKDASDESAPWDESNFRLNIDKVLRKQFKRRGDSYLLKSRSSWKIVEIRWRYESFSDSVFIFCSRSSEDFSAYSVDSQVSMILT